MKKIIALALISLGLISCNKENTKNVEKAETKVESAEVETKPEIDIYKLTAEIDAKKSDIENNSSEPIEVSTTDLREKIKQKWSKIHFYTIDSKLARIKTYPYENISKRTEEFYVDNNELILVAIEDDGSGERGKSSEELNKVYYYHQGEFIKEAKGGSESEHTVKNSDAEELQSEFNEYLEIFNSNKK